MPNLLLTIRYDGSNYHGWQVQKNAVSVQQVLQDALEALYGFRPDVKGCSRTDSGVHANMFCVSYFAPFFAGEYKTVSAINNHLPPDIKAYGCKEVSDDFHARYCTTAKEYIYQIDNGKFPNPFLRNYALHYRYTLNVELLNRAASQFEGTHDFTSFCSVKSDVEDCVRTIYSCKVISEDSLIKIIICGDGFLYNMVRIIAGTLIDVGRGRIKSDDIPQILLSKDRTRAGKTLAAKGLFLNRVFYGETES